MTFGRAIKHNILIEPSANNGFFVSVGCCKLVYIDKKDLLADLELFLKNPEQMEKGYHKINGPVAESTPVFRSERPVPPGHICDSLDSNRR